MSKGHSQNDDGEKRKNDRARIGRVNKRFVEGNMSLAILRTMKSVSRKSLKKSLKAV